MMLAGRQDTSSVSLRSIQEMGTETALETKSEIQVQNHWAGNAWVMTGHSKEVLVPSGP